MPRGVLPRLRYGAVAVALALALWAVEGLPASRVRTEVSPFRFVGHDARRGWRSLRRWARGSPWSPARDAHRETDISRPGTARERAARVVQYLAGHPRETAPLTALACAGALLA